MLVALQLVAVAVCPLNFTVLVPCVDPKPVPAMTTAEPTAPVFGLKLLMAGAAKATPVAARKSTVIATITVRRGYNI
jgi:hypothetical protein